MKKKEVELPSKLEQSFLKVQFIFEPASGQLNRYHKCFRATIRNNTTFTQSVTKRKHITTIARAQLQFSFQNCISNCEHEKLHKFCIVSSIYVLYTSTANFATVRVKSYYTFLCIGPKSKVKALETLVRDAFEVCVYPSTPRLTLYFLFFMKEQIFGFEMNYKYINFFFCFIKLGHVYAVLASQ